MCEYGCGEVIDANYKQRLPYSIWCVGTSGCYWSSRAPRSRMRIWTQIRCQVLSKVLGGVNRKACMWGRRRGRRTFWGCVTSFIPVRSPIRSDMLYDITLETRGFLDLILIGVGYLVSALMVKKKERLWLCLEIAPVKCYWTHIGPDWPCKLSVILVSNPRTVSAKS